MWRIAVIAALLATVLLKGYNLISHNNFADNIDPAGWDDAAILRVNNCDTTQMHNLTLFILYKPEVINGRLPLNIAIQTPSGERVAEQFDVLLDPQRASTANQKRMIQHFAYRNNVRWSELGEYTLYIYPREQTKGVVAAGITVDKAEI